MPFARPGPRLLTAGVSCLLAGVLTGCAAGPLAGGAPSHGEPGPSSPAVYAETGPPPGWDQPPDGPPPIPDSELSQDELAALVRTQASGPLVADACQPDQVELSLRGFDAAAGNRYTSLVVRNASANPCALRGSPGLGARGQWGNEFVLDEPNTVSGAEAPDKIDLAPGAQAVAGLHWSNPAGNDQEWISSLVVQLAPDGPAKALAAQVTSLPCPAGDTIDCQARLELPYHLDVGTFSKLAASDFRLDEA
jgi:hypothetical protein